MQDKNFRDVFLRNAERRRVEEKSAMAREESARQAREDFERLRAMEAAQKDLEGRLKHIGVFAEEICRLDENLEAELTQAGAEGNAALLIEKEWVPPLDNFFAYATNKSPRSEAELMTTALMGFPRTAALSEKCRQLGLTLSVMVKDEGRLRETWSTTYTDVGKPTHHRGHYYEFRCYKMLLQIQVSDPS